MELRQHMFTLYILILVATFLSYNHPVIAAAHDESGNHVLSIPGTYTWQYARDLGEPLSFGGGNSGFGGKHNPSLYPGINTLQGSVTYGPTGRWIGRAVPVYRIPRSKVVATSVLVRGGAANPNIYYPYGTTQPVATTRAPSTFNPYNNVYNPYGTPPQGTGQTPFNFNTNQQGVSGFNPQQNFNPYGYSQGRFNTHGNQNILYREVDPSYLLYGGNFRPRSYLFSRENNAINLSPSSFSSEELPINEAASLTTIPTNGLSDPKTELFDLPPVQLREKPHTKEKLLSVFTRNESEPLQNSVAEPEDSEDVDRIISDIIRVIPSRRKPDNTRDSRHGTSTSRVPRNRDRAQNTSDSDGDWTVDRTISDIIRVIPSRRKPDNTRDSRRGTSTSPVPRHRDRAQNTTDSDDGWTVIRPRFVATIRRTFFIPTRAPTERRDVEIFSGFPGKKEPDVKTRGFPTNRFPAYTEKPFSIGKPVIDKDLSSGAFGRGPTEKQLEPIGDGLETVDTDASVMMSMSVMKIVACVLLTRWLSQ